MPFRALQERLADVSRRCGDLAPIASTLREVVREDNADAIMAGQDGDGRPVAGLARSTLARRDGTGPARAPRGAASVVVAGLTVAVFASVARLSITKSWAVDWMRYHMDGTARMPRRDPSGVRPAARERMRDLLAAYIRNGR